MFGRKFGFGGRRRPVVASAKSALKLMRLETRCCPTITAVLAGGTLTITGNGSSDHVFVTQEDDGDLRVLGNNGGLAKVFNGNLVTTLKANLGAGFNNLNIDLTVSNGGDFDHEGFDQNPIILVTAGNDSDTVTINLGDAAGGGGGGGGDDDGRGDVVVSVALAGGNDRVNITAGGDFGGTLDMTFTMGSGNDSVAVALDGDVDGDATIDANLGTGNDTYSFDISGDVKSNFAYSVLGDTGNDYVSLGVGGTISGDATIDADLGTGNDYFTASVDGDVSGAFDFNLVGGTGNDSTSLGIGGNVDGDFNANVALGSSNDSFSLNVAGDTNGEFNLDLTSESGNDVVSVDIGGDVSGAMDLAADLGSGNDSLDVTISGNIVNDEEVFMFFNGGVGLDTATFTFAPNELTDIDFTAIFFEDVTYNEVGGGGGGGGVPTQPGIGFAAAVDAL